MKKSMLISIALLIFLAACNHKDEDGRNSGNSNYFVDPLTELCFATRGHGMAHVPCTDKVKEMIRK